MMVGTRGSGHLGLALLLVGACSAGEQEAATGIEFDPAGYDGFEETRIDLLATDCSIDSGTGNMTLTVGADETAYLFYRAADSAVLANANHGASECTATGSQKVFINSHSLLAVDNQKVIIDFSRGVFGLNSNNTVGIAIDLGAGTQDQVRIRGTPEADVFTLGSNGVTSYAAFQVGSATARNVPDLSMAGVESVTVSTGAGDDTITAQGGSVLGSGVTALSGHISVAFYGGDGNDRLTSGATSDTAHGVHNRLEGGEGNDCFPQLATLGSDVIAGGNGIDTVDYAVRSNPLVISVGANTPAEAATGSITADAPDSIVDNEWFTLDDGTATVSYYFRKTQNTKATGSITCVDKSHIANNDYFTLDDGTKNYDFEFKISGSPTQRRAGAWIDVSATADAHAVAVLVQAAINDARTNHKLDVTAIVNPTFSGVIDLTNDSYGPGKAITDGMDHTDAGDGFQTS
jgi:hypothetical protein